MRMNKGISTAILMLTFLLLAGCIGIGNYNLLKQEKGNTTIQTANITKDRAQAEQNATTLQETIIEKDPIDEVKDYINAHPMEEYFGKQEDRILSVSIMETNASLTYRVSTSDPAQESWYLAGVLFMVFPDIGRVDVQGLNAEGSLIKASVKNPTRDIYNFPEKWFGDVERKVECNVDSDCSDNNNCTHDYCYLGKCSNPRFVNTACPY